MRVGPWLVVGVKGTSRGIRRRGWTCSRNVGGGGPDSCRRDNARSQVVTGHAVKLKTRETIVSLSSRGEQEKRTRRPTPLRSTRRCGTHSPCRNRSAFPHVGSRLTGSGAGLPSPEPRSANASQAQVAKSNAATRLHHSHHRIRHRPCQHSLLLSNIHATATMNRPYDFNKVDLKPKRHHGYSVIIFIFGTLFPPLGPSSALYSVLHSGSCSDIHSSDSCCHPLWFG